jgi:polyferredoxin
MAAATPLAAYLWYSGVMNRKLAAGMAALAALEGFIFLAPIMPLELGGIVNVLTGTTALSAGVLVILAVIAFTVLVGRAFCGAVCPVGSVQELAYSVPVKKIPVRHPAIAELIRLVVFVAAVWYIDLMSFTGLYDLFALTLSASMLVAAGLVLVSAFVYRPVCRFLCPFGVLFSVFAEFSRFRLHRTENCISCGKCEKACPAGVAGKMDSKRECYLCGRCTDACKVKGALVYDGN